MEAFKQQEYYTMICADVILVNSNGISPYLQKILLKGYTDKLIVIVSFLDITDCVRAAVRASIFIILFANTIMTHSTLKYGLSQPYCLLLVLYFEDGMQ